MKLRKFLKVCGIAVLAFCLSWFVAYDFTSLSYFSPLEKASDFLASDFYAFVADSRDVKKYEDRITIVGIDDLSRPEIAGTLRAIAAARPKVTAIDILFPERDMSDTVLVNAMNMLGNVVYADIFVDEEEQSEEFPPSLYEYVDGGIPGMVNLDATSVRSVIRSFNPRFTDSDGNNFDSFAAAAVGFYSPEKYARLLARGKSSEIISFHSLEFDVLGADEVADNPELITDRIVMVGAVDDFGDIHSTPVDDAMPGVFIHAYAAATILNGNYINPVPDWVEYMLAMLLALIFIITQLSIGETKAGNMVVRWMQVGFLLLMVSLGYMVFISWGYSLDLTLPLLMVALSLLAVDIWEFAEEIPGITLKLYGKLKLLCAGILSLFRKIKNSLLSLKNPLSFFRNMSAKQ